MCWTESCVLLCWTESCVLLCVGLRAVYITVCVTQVCLDVDRCTAWLMRCSWLVRYVRRARPRCSSNYSCYHPSNRAALLEGCTTSTCTLYLRELSRYFMQTTIVSLEFLLCVSVPLAAGSFQKRTSRV